jgi:hypothetical protein
MDMAILVVGHGLPVLFDGCRYAGRLETNPGVDRISGKPYALDYEMSTDVGAEVLRLAAPPLAQRLWFLRADLEAFMADHPELFEESPPPAGPAKSPSPAGVDAERRVALITFFAQWAEKHRGKSTFNLGRFVRDSAKGFGDIPEKERRWLAEPFIYAGKPKPGRPTKG